MGRVEEDLTLAPTETNPCEVKKVLSGPDLEDQTEHVYRDKVQPRHDFKIINHPAATGTVAACNR